ncbi:hypothetical protein HGA92_05460 [Candidatus Gracilibacteria bacterium]|nr:hypothetical protein [Candidatus Gracilibacteria bacterium]NUJ99079.1 hypothetical protein [Candidatus Gracilibacteria bacterium]
MELETLKEVLYYNYYKKITEINNMNHLTQNTFLSPEEREKRNLAYYGEFIALRDFDDGWENSLYKKALNYILQSNIPIRVFEDSDKKKGYVKVILEISQLDNDMEQKIFDMSIALQREYFFTPIVQNTGFGVSEKSQVPAIVESPKQDEIGYQRYNLQKEVAKIFAIENELNKIKYQLDILSQSNEPYIQKIVEQLQEAKSQLEEKLGDLETSKNELIAQYYLNLATKNLETEVRVQISQFQASAILDLSGSDKGEKESTILDWIKKIEILMGEISQEVGENQQEYKKNLDNLLLQFQQILSQATNKEINCIETGIIGNVKIEENEITKGTLLLTNKEFYKIGNKIQGFTLPGIKEIKSIKYPKILKNGMVIGFTAEDENGNEIIFWIAGNEYKELNLHGVKNTKNINLGKNNKPYGKVMDENETHFWFEGEIYTTLKLPGVENTKSSNVTKDESGKPKYGDITDENGNETIFWLEGGEYKKLELPGVNNIKYSDITKDENGKPKYGWVKDENGNIIYFWLEGDEYKTLNLPGVKNIRSSRIQKEENGKPLYGGVKDENENETTFWTEGGEYKKLELPGVNNIKYSDIKKDENGKPKYGWVKDENENITHFWLEGDKYKTLNLPGVKNIKYSDIKKDENGKPKYGDITDENKNITHFWLEGDEYKTLNLPGVNNIKSCDIEKDENGKPLYGGVTDENENKIIFWLEGKEYKILEIVGVNNIRSSRIKKDENGKPLYGWVTDENENKIYFQYSFGKYKKSFIRKLIMVSVE